MNNLLGRFWRATFVFIFAAIIFTSNAAAPSAPLNVRGSWVNDSYALLTWDDVPDAQSFNVYRFDAAAQNWTLVASAVSVPMFHEESGSVPPLQYSVSAVNADSESDATTVTIENGGWSGGMVMYYDPSYYPWLNGRTSVTLQFAVSPVDGTDALLEFGSTPETFAYFEYRADYTGFHSFVVTNLTPGTQYFYRATFSDTNRLGISFMQTFYTLPPNAPPVASDASASMDEDGGTIIVAPSYYDPDGYLTPTIHLLTPPANGSIVTDGYAFWYTPNTNFFGTDTFTYAANDGEDDSAPATITITVFPLNDPGVFENPTQEFTILEDAALNGSVFVSDVETNQHTLVLAYPPASGSVQIDGTNFVFNAGANVSGTFDFAFTAIDENGVPASGFAWVVVHVTSVNDLPTAQSSAVSLSEDTELSLTLHGSDVETPELVYAIVNPPQHGVLSGQAPNIVYHPAPNYFGADQFTFKVIDSSAAEAVGTISIQVAAVNDGPIANNANVTTAYNATAAITLSGSDIDSASLTYVIDSLPANGTLSGLAPNLSFTPNVSWSGTTTFTYHANDGQLSSPTATVAITVQPTTTAPAAPSNLTAQAVSNSQINLSWSDNSNNEDGFRIERQNGSSWTVVGAVARGVSTFSNTGLQANKSYTYRIRAFNIIGNSAYSNTASAKTLR